MPVSGAATETVSFEDVLAATQRIEPLAQRTPVETSRHFNQAAGVRAYFKCENLQRGGSFKIRRRGELHPFAESRRAQTRGCHVFVGKPRSGSRHRRRACRHPGNYCHAD